jgi:hypothetical protein
MMTSPQNEGSPGTGADAPEERAADRPGGTVDEDANPPLTDPDESDADAGTDDLPPQDTGRAVPPYEGRQTSTKE